jgi:hypothetical protein
MLAEYLNYDSSMALQLCEEQTSSKRCEGQSAMDCPSVIGLCWGCLQSRVVRLHAGGIEHKGTSEDFNDRPRKELSADNQVKSAAQAEAESNQHGVHWLGHRGGLLLREEFHYA